MNILDQDVLKIRNFQRGKYKRSLIRLEKKKEKGCTEPLYGAKSKCIIKIVPKSKGGKSFQIDKKCIKKR